jgi:hypothetical protein
MARNFHCFADLSHLRPKPGRNARKNQRSLPPVNRNSWRFLKGHGLNVRIAGA